MPRKTNAIQARYAYLADLFRAIAFLTNELRSPRALDACEVEHFERLLRLHKNLPRRATPATRTVNASAYRVFLRDFCKAAENAPRNFFAQATQLWKIADDETKRVCAERAKHENENATRRVKKKFFLI